MTFGISGGTLAGLFGAGATAYSAYRTSQNAKQAGQAGAAIADPFAGERDKYKQPTFDLFNQLLNFSSGGYKDDPVYKATLESGIDAVNKGSAATGMLRSGNRLAALDALGQKTATTVINDRWKQLFGLLGEGATLSGATVGSPSTAGSLTYSGDAASSNAINSGVSNLFEGIGQTKWFGGGLPSTNPPTAVGTPGYGTSSTGP